MSDWCLISDKNEHAQVNQDAAVCADFVNRAGTPLRLVAVADGMTGSFHGEIGAKLAITALFEHLRDSSYRDASELAEAVGTDFFRELNRRLLESGNGQDHPSTTMTAVVFAGEGHALLHVGDTRAFFINATGRYCLPLTSDHNLEGQDPRNQVGRSGLRRYLGSLSDQWVPDVIVGHSHLVDRSGTIVVASDGVHSIISEKQILSFYNRQEGNLQAFCRDCIALAKQLFTASGRNNRDNLTIAALRFDLDQPITAEAPLWGGSAAPIAEEAGTVPVPATPGPEPDSGRDRPPFPRWKAWAAGTLVLVACGALAALVFAVLALTKPQPSPPAAEPPAGAPKATQKSAPAASSPPLAPAPGAQPASLRDRAPAPSRPGSSLGTGPGLPQTPEAKPAPASTARQAVPPSTVGVPPAPRAPADPTDGKPVLHKVDKDTDLLTLAKQLRFEPDELLQLNPELKTKKSPWKLRKGERVQVPAPRPGK